ncbi:MAG: hypothetical protein LKG11_02385 [Bacilli bacterium]|jgi:hypothetical protein|nr:hypothetical protein [Bacilli bacterium]
MPEAPGFLPTVAEVALAAVCAFLFASFRAFAKIVENASAKPCGYF